MAQPNQPTQPADAGDEFERIMRAERMDVRLAADMLSSDQLTSEYVDLKRREAADPDGRPDSDQAACPAWCTSTSAGHPVHTGSAASVPITSAVGDLDQRAVQMILNRHGLEPEPRVTLALTDGGDPQAHTHLTMDSALLLWIVLGDLLRSGYGLPRGGAR
jgi:hypothetical protein